MIDIVTFINNALKQEKMTRADLCRRINKVEERAGLKERTNPQNITNYLNGYHKLRPKWLVKVECALNLPDDTLINMVEPPKKRQGKKELEAIKEKIRKGKLND